MKRVFICGGRVGSSSDFLTAVVEPARIGKGRRTSPVALLALWLFGRRKDNGNTVVMQAQSRSTNELGGCRGSRV